MNFEHYQASMDVELKTGFVQMMARSDPLVKEAEKIFI